MTGAGDRTLRLDLLLGNVIPDTRVLVASHRYHMPTPLCEALDGATHVRGVVAGLDHRGVEWLRHVVEHQAIRACHLILGLYPGCPTWDDVLLDALDIQQQAAPRVQFRVRARHDAIDRPGNLLRVNREGEAGVLVAGNLANGLVAARWDATDANLVLPLSDIAEMALTHWFDLLYVNSRPLARDTAMAPKLHLPDGTDEGARLWRDYLAKLEEVEPEHATAIVNPDTGEVDHPTDPPPSKQGCFPRQDPVTQAVQAAMANGALVSIDRVDVRN